MKESVSQNLHFLRIQADYWKCLQNYSEGLARKIEEVMEKLVSYNQNAFIKGRQITDASLLQIKY